MATMIAQQEAVSMPAKPQIKKKIAFEDILKSPNLASKLDEETCNAIGKWVIGGYVKDLSSRIEWAMRHAQAMKIALQVKEMKTFPWTNASNVKFPLVTIGALQFLARISILTKGETIASFRVMGKDGDGEKSKRARRVSDHINFQLNDEVVGWVDADEQTKFAASILGSSFKKTTHDPVEGTNRGEFVAAQHFVVDYHCKDLQTCRRYSHIIGMDHNKLQERITREIFIKEKETHASSPDQIIVNLLEVAARESQGLAPSAETEEIRMIEQYGWLDLDGDGYEEPYIFSVREDTGHLYRIVARFFDDGSSVHRMLDNRVRQFENLARVTDDPQMRSRLERRAQAIFNSKDNKIVRIDPISSFTKYSFLPSPDGGFYGLGLGALLGPTNEAVDTLINQLIDAGTMSNTGGGWIARGARLKAGKSSFDPFEWKTVDVTGDDLRKSIVPLPIREPSAVLFNLLGVLIQYGERISSATDIMTGVAPGQNTPAETSRNTVEQGMMLFSGIYARMYRSLREELATYYYLNRLYLHHSPRFWELTQGPDAIIAPDDYKRGGLRPRPAADPSAISGQQRKDRASRLVSAAFSPVGAKWDKDAVSRKWLEAEEWDVEEIFPDPTGPRAVKPPMDPKMQMEAQRLQFDQQKHSDDMMLKVADMQSTVALNRAKILELRAKAEKHLADADSSDAKKQIAAIDAQIGALKLHNDTVLRGADMLLKGHQAKAGIETQHHKMLMDVHDRMMQEEARDRENLPQTGGNVGQNTPATNSGGAM
jgi:hypothetical protein